jgi:hypothetical protein
MTFDEALGQAKKIEFVETKETTVEPNQVTTALIVSGSYKASDFHPLTTNDAGGMEEVEAIQLYLDESWKLLHSIMLITENIAHGQVGYLSTFDKGRLGRIADDIKMLRKKNIMMTMQ